jgi:hypothetical protein
MLLTPYGIRDKKIFENAFSKAPVLDPKHSSFICYKELEATCLMEPNRLLSKELCACIDARAYAANSLCSKEIEAESAI